jgi:uncharacterized protein
MEFEWDEAKRLANVKRHGLDFMRAKEIWQGPVLEIASSQTHHGEERVIALGRVEGRLIAVVFTWRQERRRIISARAARKDEKEIYNKKVG